MFLSASLFFCSFVAFSSDQYSLDAGSSDISSDMKHKTVDG
jgi:hypothetical protein